MPALVATPLIPRQRARFRVRVPGPGNRGIIEGMFRRCSRPSAEIIKGEILGGGSVAPYKYPTSVRYRDVVLESGRTSDRGLYNWFAQVLRAAGAMSGATTGFRRTVEIQELSRRLGEPFNPRAQTVVDTWILHGAWVTGYGPGEYDNQSDEFLIENVTLTYDFFERSQLFTTTRGQTVQVDHVAARFA